MKKQINPTIKAHLIRGAFYLLLLVAVCAIPFALAQRNKLSSTRAQATKAPPTQAQIAAASGKVFQSGAAGALAGRVAPSKPAVGQNALPYDVRTAPSLPRMGELPQRTSGVRAGHVIPVPRPPKAPQVVLYDQYNNAGANATLSATFTDFLTFSADLADDFVVPGGQTWNVDSIDADGVYFNGSGPATDWNVFIYADNGGLPGAQVFSATNIPITQVGTTFTANLSPAACLAAGTYWIEIQANMTFATEGEWGWTDRTVQSNNSAAWQNPGGGFGVCPTWAAKLTCIPTASGPDQVYRINGTVVGSCGGATPTPTATGTPAGCTDYTTSTGSGAITPGDTDTGNHCDDCATSISFPFPVSVYGQTFNSANVASNGSLDLIGTEAPFTHACQVLPSNLWEMAIFPYQDDLRTDNLSWTGCNAFPGATCGVFTSTTGTAPNRQFNIEWRAVHFADTTTSANFSVVFYENQSSFFDVFYGVTSDNGLDETSGVQASATGPATTFSCGTATLTSGLKVTYTCAGGGGSPTPTPTPTGSPSCSPIVINGSIDIGDPTQTDRLNRSGIPQTCPASTTCAIFGDPNTFRYDAYTFTNTTGATQCVNIDTNTVCNADHDIFTAAYLGSFDPSNVCTNWIGDAGLSPNPDQAFQVDVDNGQTLVVVVSEVHHAGCVGYALTITGLCGGTPTPTPTATPTCTAGGGTPGPWMTASPYPTTDVRYGFAQTATHFYVFGGVDNGTRTSAVNRLDLATGMWQARAPMPFTSEAPTCALMESTGIVYCAEGDTGSGFASYNIATDTWTSLANTPNGDDYGSASGAFNGKVFLAGGTTGFSNAVWVYDVASNTWSAGTAAPDGFLLAGYKQVGQYLYVVGGWTGGAPTGLTTTTRLNMSSAPGVWESGPAFTMGRSDFGLAYDAGTNKLYALGGDLCCDGNFFNSTNEVDEVDLSGWPGGTWVTSPPNLPAPNRQANLAGFYGNGDIWSVGGIDGATFQFLADVYHRTDGGCGGVSPTPTATFTPTPTVTATATFTPTATATATFTPTATATATTTATPTATPTHPPRPTPTPEPRPTPELRPSYCYLNSSDCSGLPNIIQDTCFDCLVTNGGLSWKDAGGCHTTCPGPVRPNP